MGCNFKKQKHPDFNEVGSWATSIIGRQYAALGAKHLMMQKHLRNGILQDRERNQGRDKRKAGELTGSGMVEPKPLKSSILPGLLSHRGQAIEARIFLDTGNLGRTLIKREVARAIVSDSLIRKHDITYNVANGEPMHSCGSVELDVRIVFDDLTNDIEHLLNLRFDIVDTLNTPEADCLISQQDIYDASLLVRIPNYSGIPKDLSDATGRIPEQPRKFYTCAITRARSNLDRMHVSEFFDFEQEDMGVPEKEDSIDEALQEKPTTVEEHPPPTPIIEGPETLQAALRALVNKYIDLLQAEVSKEPARVPPFKLNVDETRWTLPGAKNTQRYRTQSAAKDNEIRRQVDLMEALGLIKRSTQTRRSQVHLVTKPNGKWRFCIDYRYLNECSDMEGGCYHGLRNYYIVSANERPNTLR